MGGRGGKWGRGGGGGGWGTQTGMVSFFPQDTHLESFQVREHEDQATGSSANSRVLSLQYDSGGEAPHPKSSKCACRFTVRSPESKHPQVLNLSP